MIKSRNVSKTIVNNFGNDIGNRPEDFKWTKTEIIDTKADIKYSLERGKVGCTHPVRVKFSFWQSQRFLQMVKMWKVWKIIYESSKHRVDNKEPV